MSKQEENIITVVDVGSAKTCALAAEVTDVGLRYRGHGITESRGSRKGHIVDLEKAASSIKKAVDEAETLAESPLEHATIGIAGPHIRGVNSQGGLALGTRPREIGRDEIRAAIDRARSISMPPDREILHLLQQEFILDDQSGVRDPAGMVGTRLEVRIHIVTASSSAIQNVVTAMNLAGMEVDDQVFEPLAAAETLLRSDDRELGVTLIDIGAGSTELIVFHEGVVVYTGSIPIGGDHFTNDIAVGLKTPVGEAEGLKRMFGCAVVTMIPEGNEIEVPTVGDRPSRLVQQRYLGEIIEPRARELFEMIRDTLRQTGVLDLCTAGIVITGGAARLNKTLDMAEDVLRKSARFAMPIPISKMPEQLLDPEFATVLGLMLYAHRTKLVKAREDQGLGAKFKMLFAKR
jgi:cell division protein FtsA